MTEPDDDLAVLLGRSIDHLPTADADAALVTVTSRSRVRRRRRAAARIGAVVAAVAAATAVWLMVRPPDRSEVHIVDAPATSPTVVTSPPSPSAPPSVPGSVPGSVSSPGVSGSRGLSPALTSVPLPLPGAEHEVPAISQTAAWSPPVICPAIPDTTRAPMIATTSSTSPRYSIAV